MKKRTTGMLLSLLLVTIPTMTNASNITSDDLVAGVSKEIISIWNTEQVAIHEIEVIENEFEVVSEPLQEYIRINSTAFCDSVLADGTEPYYGCLAGKREWLGKSVELYDLDYNYIGYFTFHDVGYGKSTGYGESALLPNRSLGNIEVGECIDVWLGSRESCFKYGRKDIYMVLVDE